MWKKDIKEIKEHPKRITEKSEYILHYGRTLYLSEILDEKTKTQPPKRGCCWDTNKNIYYATIIPSLDCSPDYCEVSIAPGFRTDFEADIRGKDEPMGVLRASPISDGLVKLIKDKREIYDWKIKEKEICSIIYKMIYGTSLPFL